MDLGAVVISTLKVGTEPNLVHAGLIEARSDVAGVNGCPGASLHRSGMLPGAKGGRAVRLENLDVHGVRRRRCSGPILLVIEGEHDGAAGRDAGGVLIEIAGDFGVPTYSGQRCRAGGLAGGTIMRGAAFSEAQRPAAQVAGEISVGQHLSRQGDSDNRSKPARRDQRHPDAAAAACPSDSKVHLFHLTARPPSLYCCRRNGHHDRSSTARCRSRPVADRWWDCLRRRSAVRVRPRPGELRGRSPGCWR